MNQLNRLLEKTKERTRQTISKLIHIVITLKRIQWKAIKQTESSKTVASGKGSSEFTAKNNSSIKRSHKINEVHLQPEV